MSKRSGYPGYPAKWCIHFRSMSHHETCEAGVSYASLPHPMAKMPCFLPHGPEVARCEHFRAPTEEEIELYEEWAEGRKNLLLTVMTGILPWRKANKGGSHAEVVECPACKGRLHLSISSYNDHVHGRCETEGCVSWME